MELKESEKKTRLTNDESCILDLYRRATALNFAELIFVVHNGKLATASLVEKHKF